MQQSLFDTASPSLDLPNAELAYTADFIADQQQCYQQLLESIDWQQDTIQLYGRPVLIPRLNAWYGDEGAGYHYSGLQLSPKPWAPALLAIKYQLEQFLNTSFNSVLANYYRDGQDSVAWHSDDESELGPTPLIASISLGASRRFSLRPCHQQEPAGKPVHIELQGGSLLVMAGTTQQHWQHQLPKTSRPVAGRINLTFRTVLPYKQR
jgi:alkylated DNA repair dioxygenase AlkB